MFLLIAMVLALCVFGLLHPAYQENLGHCTGLALVALWSMGALYRALSTGVTPPHEALLCLGLLLFGAGTGVRTWIYNRKS